MQTADYPNTATTAWHLLLMLFTSLVILSCGMAFHSSTRISRRSASVVRSVTLCLTDRPSWSHKCSMGLRSGLFAGYSILSMPSFCRYSLKILALCGRALSSWQTTFGPRLRRKYGCATDWRTSSLYLCFAILSDFFFQYRTYHRMSAWFCRCNFPPKWYRPYRTLTVNLCLLSIDMTW